MNKVVLYEMPDDKDNLVISFPFQPFSIAAFYESGPSPITKII